ncbi:MAG: hypothetical protein K5880_13790 [Hydrogenophaga sp.]|uniref:hypothetical protein n=1 Tax=Hydrogenophaga sp. TaxID=1904254 RepID=UPI0026162416|nr:hypothetical protein [Hydrogenophaga sp.]MCV0439693.1 hypothetical protein [Hydrogenophaga sp.]
MPTYRVEVETKVRENFVVEADSEEAAEAMVLSGSVSPVISEPLPGEEEVVDIEEIP